MANELAVEPHEDVSNPILSADDVTDLDQAEFVADPFYIKKNDIHYVFFEILKESNKGVIGYATSSDGRDWSYQQVILEEPFHLSFPYIFRYKHDWYLIPEYVTTSPTQPLRIYTNIDSLTEWRLYKTVLPQKKIADPVVFQWDGLWYVVVQNRRAGVSLYFSDKPDSSDWTSHPENPITSTDRMGRMAGRPFIDQHHRLHLLFQDGRYLYGEKVHCCRINILTPDEYEHSEISTSPIVQGQFNCEWNDRGMHHVDVSPYTEHGQDFVLVDGCDKNGIWSIGLYQVSKHDQTPHRLSQSQKARRYSTILKDKARNAQYVLQDRWTNKSLLDERRTQRS